MKQYFTNPFFLFVLSVFVTGAGAGCALLPNVSQKIADAPPSGQAPEISSTKGLLSPEKSKALFNRLKHSTNPTDILERHNAVIESVSESTLTKGNKVTLLIDGAATYAAMFKAIEGAKDHINLETFIIDDDEVGRKFADLLLQKQSHGVAVSVIYDSIGSFDTPASFFQRLRDGGVQVVEFNPRNPLKPNAELLPLHQDHRKILIIDGKLAITGGINLSKVYTSRLSGRKKNKDSPLPWRDTDVQIEGPAVAELQKLFLDTWSEQKGPKLAERNYFPTLQNEGSSLVRILGSTPGQSNRVTFIMYVSAIIFAETSIHLTNAYFVPDDQTLDALKDAAKRGVDVKLLLPSTTDFPMALSAQRYNYTELLESGVKIYEQCHALLHAKTGVIDGVWSTVGSTNMDFWSLSSNDEANAIILSREFAAEMEKMFAEDIGQADEVRLEDWKKRRFASKLKQWWAHLFSHWL